MNTKELWRVLKCLERIKQPNAFADEAIAYVKKDLAIRDQQSKAMRDMNRSDYEVDGRPW